MDKFRPGKSATFKQPLDGELKRIWLYLANVIIGPAWRFYVCSDGTNDGLYLQRYNKDSHYWVSLIRFQSSGAVTVLGAVTDSTALVDVGN